MWEWFLLLESLLLWLWLKRLFLSQTGKADAESRYLSNRLAAASILIKNSQKHLIILHISSVGVFVKRNFPDSSWILHCCCSAYLFFEHKYISPFLPAAKPPRPRTLVVVFRLLVIVVGGGAVCVRLFAKQYFGFINSLWGGIHIHNKSVSICLILVLRILLEVGSCSLNQVIRFFLKNKFPPLFHQRRRSLNKKYLCSCFPQAGVRWPSRCRQRWGEGRDKGQDERMG